MVSMFKNFMDFKKQLYFNYKIRDKLKGLNLSLNIVKYLISFEMEKLNES